MHGSSCAWNIIQTPSCGLPTLAGSGLHSSLSSYQAPLLVLRVAVSDHTPGPLHTLFPFLRTPSLQMLHSWLHLSRLSSSVPSSSPGELGGGITMHGLETKALPLSHPEGQRELKQRLFNNGDFMSGMLLMGGWSGLRTSGAPSADLLLWVGVFSQSFPASLSWVDRPLNRWVHAPGSSQGLCVPHICCFSVTQSCATLCDSMDCSVTGFPVFDHLPGFPQTHVH